MNFNDSAPALLRGRDQAFRRQDRVFLQVRRTKQLALEVDPHPAQFARDHDGFLAQRQALGKDPELEARVDPTILGGLKVRVGSRLFDASLKSRLDQLKFALKRA